MRLDGVDYSTVEQYYQHQKALYFNDDVTATSIMMTQNPFVIKQLGKTVKGFDDRKWMKVKEEIMHRGLYDKFSRHFALRRYLLDRKGALIEANPYDTYWGVGVGKTLAGDRRNWRGKNRMGHLLSIVRKEIEPVEEADRLRMIEYLESIDKCVDGEDVVDDSLIVDE